MVSECSMGSSWSRASQHPSAPCALTHGPPSRAGRRRELPKLAMRFEARRLELGARSSEPWGRCSLCLLYHSSRIVRFTVGGFGNTGTLATVAPSFALRIFLRAKRLTIYLKFLKLCHLFGGEPPRALRFDHADRTVHRNCAAEVVSIFVVAVKSHCPVNPPWTRG